MIRYELLVKNGTDWYDVTTNEVPVMTYQINDFGDLENRNVNYSQRVTAPLSKSNSIAFGYSDIPDYGSDFQYTKHDCRLYVEGKEVAGVGSVLIMLSIKGVFEFQILGNAGFFTLLQSNLIEDMTGGEVSLRYDAIDPSLYGDLFKSVRYHTLSNVGQDPLVSRVYHGVMLPVIMIAELIRVITEDVHGYTVNYLDTPYGLTDAAITLATKKAVSGFMDSLIVDLYGAVNSTASPTVSSPVGYEDIPMEALSLLEYGSAVDGLGRDVYYPELTMQEGLDYLVDISLNILTGTSVEVRVYTDGGYIYQNLIVGSSSTVVIPTISVPYSESPISIVIFGQTTTYNYSATLGITPVEDLDKYPDVPPSGTIDMFQNTGFDSQLDIFKAFVNLFGLIVQVDEVNKIVNFCTTQYSIDNRDNADDWSDKVPHDAIIDRTFDLGYAQRNLVSFQENTIDGVNSYHTVECNNTTLKGSKTIVSLPFESGKNMIRDGFPDYAKINFWDYDSEADDKYTLLGCKPHVLSITSNTIDMAILDYDDTYLDTYTMNTAIHRNMQWVDTNYSGLSQILTDPLTITLPMLITSEDVEELDQLKPKYLHQFGKFFYANKLSNYQDGELTQVELIKIIG